MRLHIANCTKQNQRIYYRLDFDQAGMPRSQMNVQPRHQDLLPGRQAAIGGDLDHISQVESIVTQLNRFGLAAVKDIPRLKQFTPYIYNVDKPVTADQIRIVDDHNRGVLANQGAVRREAAAIAATEVVVGTDKVTIGIEQVSESEYGGKLIAEGVINDRTAAEPPKGRGAGRRNLNVG